MKKFLKQKWLPVMYFILFGFTFLFFYVAGRSGEDHAFKIQDDIAFATPWNYEFSDGTSGTTELPATLNAGDSKTLILSNTLPEITDKTAFYFRARHVDVNVYVDDICIYESQESNSSTCFSLPGNYWVEVELRGQDSGKEIRLELSGNVARYLGGPGSVYLGERGSFLMQLQKDNVGTIIGASVLLLLAIILVILCVMLYVITKEVYRECICLAFFTLSISLWGFTETRCLQFTFQNMKQFSVFAFEILALAPVPIALYFTYNKRERTRRLAKIAAVIPMLFWIGNNILHFTHILELAQTLRMTQIMIVVDSLFIAYIQVSDIIYSLKYNDTRQKKYACVPLFGLLVLMPLLLVDLMKYIHSGKYYISQANFTCLGIVVYIIALACHSGLKIVEENSKAVSENEAKNQFLANMSHEIRTPLNAVLGFNEMILRSTKDKNILEYAADIQSSGENLLEIINKILDISKIEAGKMEIVEASYSTIQMLDHITSMISTLAMQKNLYVKLDIDPELPEQLVGDEMHIRQVLVNLLTNAVKYTREGGITFTVKVLERSEKDDVCKVFYSVKDTGIGIREEDRERLFEKFERLDYQKNKDIEGTGLGMSLVTSLLNAMGSKIELTSVYGEGSEFYFVLEQRAEEEACVGDYESGRKQRIVVKEQHQSYIAPDACILIVDDVKVNLKVACGLLKPLRMQVDTADSGKKAIEMVQKKRYDIILMDHMMPEMDGIEATKQIRNLADMTGDTYYCKLPILALTANVMSGMYERYIEEGMQDFISKPINERELQDILRKWLPNDKVIFNFEKEPETEQNAEENETDAWEIEIPGIDIASAKQYYTDKEAFEECLQDYLNSVPEISEKISRFRHNQDKENYTITVHGLKSASKMVGANEISEFAKALEENCHQGEYEVAWNGAERLLGMLQVCAEDIQTYLGVETDAPAEVISEEAMRTSLTELKDIAENFDMEKLLEWEKNFTNISVPEAFAADWAEVKKLVQDVSFLEIGDKISQMDL